MAKEGGNPQNLTPGNPGNRGGKGAIPKTLRALCRDEWAKGIPNMAKIATGKKDGASPSEEVSAWNALGKYGMGELQGVSVEDAEVARTAVKVAHSIYGPEMLQEFTDALLEALGMTIEDDDDAGRPAEPAPKRPRKPRSQAAS